MTVINRGATGAWYVFRGEDARTFLAALVVVATWPCAFKGKGVVSLRARLLGHDSGTFSLVFDNDGIPEGTMRELFHYSVRAAKEELARKHAANGSR